MLNEADTLFDLRLNYLEIVKKTLLHSFWDEEEPRVSPIIAKLKTVAPRLFGRYRGSAEEKLAGQAWPEFAYTMIGIKRLENIQYCVEQVIKDKVKGDLIETGVWRGGACIFMRALLKSYGIKDRTVWLADSFQGLPPPNAEKYPADKGDKHHSYLELRVGIEAVRKNFEMFGLLDEQVRFLEGWFKDTLPSAPIEKLSVCRLDGDMYESTMDALSNLYPKLEIGGFLIVDDFGAVPACEKAIVDYRERHGISEPITKIDWSGVYWRRER